MATGDKAMNTEKWFITIILTLLASAIAYELYGAEIECKEVQVVDAWSKEFGIWIPVSFYDCGSYSYTEPKVAYEVLGGEIIWYIVEDGEQWVDVN
jgi:hypothetical protein